VPRLLRLVEALVRTPGSGDHNCDPIRGSAAWDLFRAFPTHLPEMQLFYSSPSTAGATLSAVTSLTKWLQAHVATRPPHSAATAMSRTHEGPMREAEATLDHLWQAMLEHTRLLADFTVQSLVRPALLMDPTSLEDAAAAAAAAAPAGRRSRAWLKEQALLSAQPDQMVNYNTAAALASYKVQVAASPQLVASILEQLQQGVGAHQRAAAARQAAKLAKKQGGDVAALTQQLQAVQVGGAASGGAAESTVLQQALLLDTGGSSTAATSTAAGGVPPVTPGDITVAANALLVACKAAGALLEVPQPLERLSKALKAHQWVAGSWAPDLSAHAFETKSKDLLAAIQEVAEWAVLLHPLLVQLLPAEQGQVLADLRGRLGGGSSSSRSSIKKLSAEEVAAVLGALQHVVIPGQPGCSNPRCCCLEGASEAEMKTQVCAGCRGARYCSAACQKAHWKAGHKEVCKAAQAAAKAAAATGGGVA
jgi:hypothetical protein